MTRLACLCVVCLATILNSYARAAETAAEEKTQEKPWMKAKPDVVRAWQDDRFGMFLCWGPVSLTGEEIGWSRAGVRRDGRRPGTITPTEVYDNLYKRWTPDRFDAKAWVQVAKDAGCRYMIFLVKHHDGFCLYDTKLTDHRITGPESAWKHDVMKDVADACHEAGLKLIIYYSQPDWHHPDYFTENHPRYIEYLHGQIRELLTGYGRIDGLWFDLGGKPEHWDTEELFKMARELQPWLIINNRCGAAGDFDTPEQSLGRFQPGRPWESCVTLGTQWAWKPNDRLKSLGECIDLLVTCAGRGGNLALNTNPMPDGRIEPRQAERFRQIGQWLQKYGDSIYGTRGGPFLTAQWGLRFGTTNQGINAASIWGVSTHKDNKIFLHILDAKLDRLTLPPIDRKIVTHSVMTGGTARVVQTDQGIEISVPAEHRQELDTIVVLELDGPAAGLEPVRQRSGSLTFGKKATASNVFQKMELYGPEKAFDDDPTTRWGCDYGTHACWLAVDLGEPNTFDRAVLSEPYGRVRKFALEAQRDDVWETFHEGTTIGENLSVEFPPTTARHVRLNLLETTEGPSIWEFQLFAPKK
ncbi:MAG: alpha-L-fucosidase [Thermoguttaceae bacterium]